MRREEIHGFADSLKAKHGTADPLRIASDIGVLVRYFAFEELKGAYTKIKRCRFILINDRLCEAMRDVVAAHELGHIFLHEELADGDFFREKTFFDMSSKPEMEANIFAANLLICDEEMLEENACGNIELPPEIVLIKAQDMNSRGYKLNLPSFPRGDFLGR